VRTNAAGRVVRRATRQARVDVRRAPYRKVHG
jgi:hypothetical protein